MAVRLRGSRGPDGYVVDFGYIKKLLTQLCKQLNQHILLPTNSDVLEVRDNKRGNVEVVCEDGSFFSFPEADVKKLPIAHTSAEELAEYLLNELIKTFAEMFSVDYLITERGVDCIELSVSEAPTQTATCTRYLDVSHTRNHVSKLGHPSPCLPRES